MTRQIDELRGFLKGYLTAHPRVSEVAAKTASSGRVHLSVYRTTHGKPLGVEYDKDTLQNLWLRAGDAPSHIPSGVKTTDKAWTGHDWASPDGKGANSNLRGYDDFRGHDLIRLGVKTQADAEEILNHLLK